VFIKILSLDFFNIPILQQIQIFGFTETNYRQPRLATSDKKGTVTEKEPALYLVMS
jgi:hypothetical protein